MPKFEDQNAVKPEVDPKANILAKFEQIKGLRGISLIKAEGVASLLKEFVNSADSDRENELVSIIDEALKDRPDGFYNSDKEALCKRIFSIYYERGDDKCWDWYYKVHNGGPMRSILYNAMDTSISKKDFDKLEKLGSAYQRIYSNNESANQGFYVHMGTQVLKENSSYADFPKIKKVIDTAIDLSSMDGMQVCTKTIELLAKGGGRQEEIEEYTDKAVRVLRGILIKIDFLKTEKPNALTDNLWYEYNSNKKTLLTSLESNEATRDLHNTVKGKIEALMQRYEEGGMYRMDSLSGAF